MSTTQRFVQERKDAASSVEDQVRECLAEYYDTPENCVVSTEHARDGAYETGGEYVATDLLDYAGVDWLVDDRPAIVAVGERIRPNDPERRDFSLRLENGCARPCEADRIPAGLQRGVAPATIFFGWRTGDTLDRAWLLDTQAVFEAVAAGDVHVDERASGDGTVAGYIPVGELVQAGSVLDSWNTSTTEGQK